MEIAAQRVTYGLLVVGREQSIGLQRLLRLRMLNDQVDELLQLRKCFLGQMPERRLEQHHGAVRNEHILAVLVFSLFCCSVAVFDVLAVRDRDDLVHIFDLHLSVLKYDEHGLRIDEGVNKKVLDQSNLHLGLRNFMDACTETKSDIRTANTYLH